MWGARRALIVGVVAALTAMPGAAGARGWHWTRHVTCNGSTSTAHGRTCSTSKFSDGHWVGRFRSGGDTYTFRWTERIRNDGHFRHLDYTAANSSAWNNLTPSERDAVRTAVIHGLERTTVGWLDDPAGRECLQYRVAGDEYPPVRWTPQPGC